MHSLWVVAVDLGALEHVIHADEERARDVEAHLLCSGPDSSWKNEILHKFSRRDALPPAFGAWHGDDCVCPGHMHPAEGDTDQDRNKGLKNGPTQVTKEAHTETIKGVIDESNVKTSEACKRTSY